MCIEERRKREKEGKNKIFFFVKKDNFKIRMTYPVHVSYVTDVHLSDLLG